MPVEPGRAAWEGSLKVIEGALVVPGDMIVSALGTVTRSLFDPTAWVRLEADRLVATITPNAPGDPVVVRQAGALLLAALRAYHVDCAQPGDDSGGTVVITRLPEGVRGRQVFDALGLTAEGGRAHLAAATAFGRSGVTGDIVTLKIPPRGNAQVLRVPLVAGRPTPAESPRAAPRGGPTAAGRGVSN
jgi:hypothetical protein